MRTRLRRLVVSDSPGLTITLHDSSHAATQLTWFDSLRNPRRRRLVVSDSLGLIVTLHDSSHVTLMVVDDPLLDMCFAEGTHPAGYWRPKGAVVTCLCDAPAVVLAGDDALLVGGTDGACLRRFSGLVLCSVVLD